MHREHYSHYTLTTLHTLCTENIARTIHWGHSALYTLRQLHALTTSYTLHIHREQWHTLYTKNTVIESSEHDIHYTLRTVYTLYIWKQRFLITFNERTAVVCVTLTALSGCYMVGIMRKRLPWWWIISKGNCWLMSLKKETTPPKVSIKHVKKQNKKQKQTQTRDIVLSHYHCPYRPAYSDIAPV